MALIYSCRIKGCLVSSEGDVFKDILRWHTRCYLQRIVLTRLSDEHKMWRSHAVTPLFLWDGSGIISINMLFTTSINKGHGSISVINAVAWPAHHMQSVLPQVQANLSAWYLDFCSVAPYLRASSKHYRSSWQKEGTESKLCRLHFLGI